ncbi:hypothetical protein APR41_17785 [Salegentibacter salinarum]|uniref:Thioredoxin domain-containing protein n=2 Tax=Salegentibacter salinarum TaxID=447422 RepID=A0A2N0TV69_9FLAO|nr:hypothetical protein APR41_17785 [Salegentibacter salinarum]
MISTSCQKSFQGNDKVRILDNFNEVSSLEELINLPEFKNKILYINLFSFYCKHSVDEFTYIEELQSNSHKNLKVGEDVAFIHLSTPKWAFESFWKSNVEDYDLAGYHFLMNEKFLNNFWSHFPEAQKGTPFFIQVTMDKKISKTFRPSTMIQKAPLDAALNDFVLQTFKFVRANLDSVLSGHPEKYDLLFKFDKSSEEKISFFTYSKNDPDNSNEVDVWKNLNVFAERSFDSIPDKDGLSGYSFAIPLNVKTLDSIIPE